MKSNIRAASVVAVVLVSIILLVALVWSPERVHATMEGASAIARA